MNKIVLVPDSFKGTMSSQEICCIMKKEILSFFPQAQVLSVPVADGGEGSVDAFLAAVGGEKITLPIRGPYFEPIKGFLWHFAGPHSGHRDGSSGGTSTGWKTKTARSDYDLWRGTADCPCRRIRLLQDDSRVGRICYQ